MKNEVLTDKNYLFYVITFYLLGIIVFFLPELSTSIFHIIVSTGVILYGFITVFYNMLKRKGLINTLISILIIFIGLYFLNNKYNMLSIFPLIFSSYVLLLTAIKFSIFIIYKIRGIKGFYRLLISAIIDLIFTLIIISNVIQSINFLTRMLGIYLIIIGTHYLIDWFFEYHTRNNTNRSFRWTMPTIISLFIPYRLANKINKSLTKEKNSINKNLYNDKVDLEILISVKDSNIGRFGHADFIFDNKVYSYGCYDEDSKRFFDMAGDGTLFIVNNRDKYLKFCIEHSKKTFFAFGITLTDNQKEKVRKEIDRIMEKSYEWKCIQELDPENDYQDYGSCLYKATKAKFYKFNKNSEYHLYYALWTNCVKIVDQILGVTGSALLRLNGVITPGSYYYFLDEEYKRKNSNVISKEIISDANIKK